MDGWMDGWTDGETYGRTDGETYGRTDGWTDGQIDGRTDGRYEFSWIFMNSVVFIWNSLSSRFLRNAWLLDPLLKLTSLYTWQNQTRALGRGIDGNSNYVIKKTCNQQTDWLTNGWTDRRMDGQTDGRADGRTEGQTDPCLQLKRMIMKDCLSLEISQQICENW